MFDLFKFLLLSAVYFFIPGSLLLSLIKTTSSRRVLFSLAWILGISVFIFISLFIRWLGLNTFWFYLYGVLNVGIALNYGNKWLYLFDRSVLRISNLFMGLIIFLLAAALVIGHLRSGLVNGEMQVFAARDTFWHLALTSELTKQFPPQLPGFPPVILKNYHYFYDLLLAQTSQITGIEIFDLYTKYFAFLSAFLFVFLTYSVIRVLVRNKWLAIFGTTLTVGTGNLSYVLPWISAQYHFTASPGLFMANQPFDQAHNPFNLMSYAFFLGLILFVNLWQSHKEGTSFLLLSLTLAVLTGIKIYAGILGFIAVTFLIFWEILIDRKFRWYYICPYIFSIPLVFLIKAKQVSFLNYNPGWLLTKMIGDRDRLNLADMVSKETYYQSTGNLLRLLQLKLIQLLIYFTGNLNIRLLALGFIFKAKLLKPIGRQVVFFCLIAAIFSFVLPLLFVQSRATYDSIQFTHYGLLILSIFSLVVIESIIKNILRQFRLAGTSILIIVLLVIGLPTNLVVLLESVSDPLYLIDKDEMAGLEYLKSQTSQNTIVLTDLSAEKLAYMYIPAMAQRRTYLSGIGLTEQTGIATRDRETAVKEFFTWGEKERVLDFLRKNKIEYLYLSKSGLRYSQVMKSFKIEPVFANSGAEIYHFP